MPGRIRQESLDHGIVRVTLDQPEKHNAISTAMWDELAEAFTALTADLALRCVILTGAGNQAFSAGADISEFATTRSTIDQARAYGQRTHTALSAIAACRHPVIAQIHGLCVGGGLEIACVCDLRIAANDGRFGIPIKRLGLVVGYSELAALVRLIGPANALEILLEGRLYDSAQALRMGLVNRTVASAELEQHVLTTAQRIAEGAPLAARWHKNFLRRLQDPRPLSAAEIDEALECFATADFQNGYRAFLAKQAPQFRGK
ncbi:MAG: enoyl-CoA hydratase-related protein [Gammaproteobacteria bacterium]